jgi:hypothetical protein
LPVRKRFHRESAPDVALFSIAAVMVILEAVSRLSIPFPDPDRQAFFSAGVNSGGKS